MEYSKISAWPLVRRRGDVPFRDNPLVPFA